jgi:small GTP-binding protein
MLKGAEYIPGPVSVQQHQQLDDREGGSTTPESDMEKEGQGDEDFEPRKQQQKCDAVYNVIMMGDSGVGKTDLIGRLCQSDDFKTQFFATIGINMESHILEFDGRKCKLQIWDPSGSERFRKVVTQYFPIAKGIVFVYDVNYQKSFTSIQQWVRLVQAHPEIDRLIPKCLIGNKCDMGDKRRMVPASDGEALAAAHGMRFFETSTISGLNVDKAFGALCQDMHRHNSGPSQSNSVPSQLSKLTI